MFSRLSAKYPIYLAQPHSGEVVQIKGNEMTTETLSRQVIQNGTNLAQAERMGQYSLWQILGIWALASIPMGLLSWVVYPAVLR